MGIPAYLKCKQRIEDGKFVAPPLAIEMAEERKAQEAEKGVTSATTDTKEATSAAIPLPPKTKYERFMASALSSMNTDIHAAVKEDDTAVMAVHANAERFDKKAEAMFTYLQVFSACFDALAHGANDVANAVGPFATLYLIHQNNEVSSKQ